MPDETDPSKTLNPAQSSYEKLPTTSYKGPYGEVVTTQRPPHRQFPQQAWGLQTVRRDTRSHARAHALKKRFWAVARGAACCAVAPPDMRFARRMQGNGRAGCAAMGCD